MSIHVYPFGQGMGREKGRWVAELFRLVKYYDLPWFTQMFYHHFSFFSCSSDLGGSSHRTRRLNFWNGLAQPPVGSVAGLLYALPWLERGWDAQRPWSPVGDPMKISPRGDVCPTKTWLHTVTLWHCDSQMASVESQQNFRWCQGARGKRKVCCWQPSAAGGSNRWHPFWAGTSPITGVFLMGTSCHCHDYQRVAIFWDIQGTKLAKLLGLFDASWEGGFPAVHPF